MLFSLEIATAPSRFEFMEQFYYDEIPEDDDHNDDEKGNEDNPIPHQ